MVVLPQPVGPTMATRMPGLAVRLKSVSYTHLVLVSQGGAPKDINLYQTQKALDLSLIHI